MKTNNLVSHAQHAFCKNHSTETAFIHMMDEWLTALDEVKLVSLLLSEAISTDGSGSVQIYSMRLQKSTIIES